MPLLGERTRTQKETIWDSPRGMLREVRVREDGKSAIYVVEEQPAFRKVRWRKSAPHRVFMPWRYFLIEVGRTGYFRGNEQSYVFFANERATTLYSPVLKAAPLPNVYSSGGICMGNTAAYGPGRPLHGVAMFLRDFYRLPGNAMLCGGKYISLERRKTPLCANGCLASPLLCAWSTMTPEEAMRIDWMYTEYASIDEAIQKLNFKFLSRNHWDDNSIERFMTARRPREGGQ